MVAKYILYIIPTIFLQTQSFYMENETKWPNTKLDYSYDSIEDALKNNAPAKNETQIIKDKLSSLITRTKEDVSEKMSAVEQVHRNFENNSIYKVGHIVSFLNSTYENFNDMYQFIDKNKKDWSVLMLLENYEQVRAAENFVTQMLRVLQNLMSKKQKQTAHDTRNKQQNQYESGIAWSYYDDAGH